MSLQHVRRPVSGGAPNHVPAINIEADTPRAFANQGDCVSYVATGGQQG